MRRASKAISWSLGAAWAAALLVALSIVTGLDAVPEGLDCWARIDWRTARATDASVQDAVRLAEHLALAAGLALLLQCLAGIAWTIAARGRSAIAWLMAFGSVIWGLPITGFVLVLTLASAAWIPEMC